jgi:hypothetical protein
VFSTVNEELADRDVTQHLETFVFAAKVEVLLAKHAAMLATSTRLTPFPASCPQRCGPIDPKLKCITFPKKFLWVG